MFYYTLHYSAQLSLALCFEYCQPYSYVIFSSRAVMRSLLSHQYKCDPGSNPGVDAICELSLLLDLSFAPRGFSMHPRAYLVCYTAVFSVVTQRSSPCDDTKNGCVADYVHTKYA